MSEKHLTELGWKTLVTKQKLKDPGLTKALAEFGRCGEQDPEGALKALALVEKHAETLQKEHKKNEEVNDYLKEVFKEADKRRKALELLKKSAAKLESEESEAEGEEDEEDKGLDLKNKLITWLKKVKMRKADDPPVEAMVCKGVSDGKAGFAVVLAKKVGAGQKKLLQEFFKGAPGLKFSKGTCEFGAMDIYTFVLESLPSGAAKGLKAFLKEQTGITYKIKVRDTAGSEETDLAESEEAKAPPVAPPKPVVEAPKPDPAKAAAEALARFKARLSALQPGLLKILAAGGAAAQEIKLKVSEAGVHARKQHFAPAERLLDDLETLLKKSGGAVPPPPTPKPAAPATPPAPPKPAGAPKLSTYMNATRDWKAAKAAAANGIFALKSAILKACDPELDKAVKAKIDNWNGILTVMDDGLITKIQEAGNEADEERQAERNRLLVKSVTAMLDTLRQHPLASVADSNPFGSFAIRAPLESVLTKIAADFGN